eukprot:Selendium_serpulae@DN6033_c0_g1_i3.p1
MSSVQLRVPKHCRKLCYNSDTAVLYMAGSSNNIYRLDLELGAFETPLQSPTSDDISALALCPSLPLLVSGGEHGAIEGWDCRVKHDGGSTSKPVTRLQVTRESDDDTNGRHVTCCDFSPNGLHLAVGTSSGLVRVYDIRTYRPFVERDHFSDLPIRSVQCVAKGSATHSTAEAAEDSLSGMFMGFHDQDNVESGTSETIGVGSLGDGMNYFIASADAKSAKFWTPDITEDVTSGISNGALIASIQPTSAINSCQVWPQSGLVFMPKDEKRIGIYFIPALGVAPRWCAFLDGMTQEFEEKSANDDPAIFDNFQFVTRSTLEQMGADHLIGSEHVRAYMHGYFMDARLYKKLKAVSEPFAYEEYRKKRIQERLEAKRKMRTPVPVKDVAVNSGLMKKLRRISNVDEDEKTKKRSKKALRYADNARKLIQDERFAKIFTHPDFEIEKAGGNAD